MEDTLWLIVDPDLNACLRLAQILRRLVKRVQCVATGSDAVQLLKQVPIAGMFCELKLPDRWGMTLVAEAKRLLPRLPIVTVSRDASMEDTIDAFRGGVTDFVIKPVSQSAVITAWERMQLAADKPETSVVQPSLPKEVAETQKSVISVELGGSLRQIEQQVVREVIYRLDGNKAAAARALGIHRKALYRLLQP